MPCLRIKLPNNQGEVIQVLSGERITIGSDSGNSIQIDDKSVSAQHAILVAVNGRYHLHDLGSTNLTRIDNRPVTDFSLDRPCSILFGSIKAEYALEPPNPTDGEMIEWVPTRAEMEFLRRENEELQEKHAALQKQVEIIGNARLITQEVTKGGVALDIQRKAFAECDRLEQENAALKLEAESFQFDTRVLMRDRDAMRQAWAMVSRELASAQEELSQLRSPVQASADSIPSSMELEPSPDPESSASGDIHRGVAQVLTKAPGLIRNLRASLEKLSDEPMEQAVREVLEHAEALATCTGGVSGHPVHRLASAIDFFLRDRMQRQAPLDVAALRPVTQAAEIIPSLLSIAALKRAKDLRRPQVLALDDDPDLLATLIASLETVDLTIVGHGTAARALSELRAREFDLVFLDIDMPDASGLDTCSEIRALPGYRKTPIVFLSAGDTLENRAQSSLNGGSDFIAKPFNILELTLRAETWIYKHQFGLL